jgi:hypothetical protein
VAQQHLSPETWLPPVRRENTVTMLPTTATTTNPAEPRPAETSPTRAPEAVVVTKPATRSRLLTGSIAVARRAFSLTIRYRVELAPAGAVSSLTALGWAQNLAGAGTGTVLAYSAAAAITAAAAGLGLHLKHDKLIAAGSGLTVALANVATATGAGISGTSLTADAIATGLAYTAYVPWLVKHRKEAKALQGKAHATANANASVDIRMGKDQAAINATATSGTEQSQHIQAGPFWDKVIPYTPETSRDIADPIAIGYDEHGNRVELPLLYRHTLIAGASDWGKSGLLNLIIKKLLKKNDVELYGIDLKPGTPELGPWRPLFKKIAATPEEARDLLKFIDAEGQRRGAYLEQLSLAELAAGREPVRKWIPGKHGTAIYVITDELGELIRQDEQLRKEEAEYRKVDKENALPPEPAVTTLFESGLAKLRFLAVQFIAATQQPSARVFGGNTDMRGNYTNRISTRAGEAGHAEFVFGKGCRGNGFVPEKLTRPGEFFLQSPEMPQIDPPRCRAEWVSDTDIAADVAHLHSGQAAQPIGRFAPQGRLTLLKQPEPPKPAGPPAPVYPDGSTVGRAEWPDLYRVFCQLCEEQGHATKDDLVERGPFESRDTVRRALEVWQRHGVQVRKSSRTEQFHLPEEET